MLWCPRLGVPHSDFPVLYLTWVDSPIFGGTLRPLVVLHFKETGPDGNQGRAGEGGMEHVPQG